MMSVRFGRWFIGGGKVLVAAILFSSFGLAAAEETKPASIKNVVLPRPELFLLKQKDAKGTYVLPLVFIKKVNRGADDGVTEEDVIFQFADTRRETDEPNALE